MMEDNMQILIGCEESQTVTKAFRKNGHKALSSNIMKFYCHHCQKEFELPEWCTKCPECLGDDLEINDKGKRVRETQRNERQTGAPC